MNEEQPKRLEYLGDSVYVETWGEMILLFLCNGEAADRENEIWLEPETLEALEKYIAKFREEEGN
jgi:putative component of toxin-antitoxin plasmid stabilization module